MNIFRKDLAARIRKQMSNMFHTPSSSDDLILSFTNGGERAIAATVAGQMSNLALEHAAKMVEKHEVRKVVPEDHVLTVEMVEYVELQFNAVVLGYFKGKILLKRNQPTFDDKPYMMTHIHMMEMEDGSIKTACYWSVYDLTEALPKEFIL